MKKQIKYLMIPFLLLLVFCIWFYTNGNQIEGEYVVVEYNEVELLRFHIQEDAIYQVKGDIGIVNIEVKDSRFHVFDVECPNHDCENMGWIDKDSLIPMITCLPNKIVILLE